VSEFNLKTYRLELYDGETNTYTAKMRVLCEYLVAKFSEGDYDKFDNSNLIRMTEMDIIDSLNFYIKYNGSEKTRATGDFYIATVTKFFDWIRKEHGIVNPIFLNKDSAEKLNSKLRHITSQLKAKEDKGVISDNEFDELNDYITSYLSSFFEGDIRDEIKSAISKGKVGFDIKYNNRLVVKYNRLISVIAVKMALLYGIQNDDVAKLKMNDFGQIENTLRINKIIIPVKDAELAKAFTIYMKLRNELLIHYPESGSFLLVAIDGTPLNSMPKQKNRILYCLMDELFGHHTAKMLYNYGRIQMLKKGLGSVAVSIFTRTPINTIRNLEEGLYPMHDRIISFFKDNDLPKVAESQSSSLKSETQYSMLCSYCGELKPNTSDFWMLVQFELDGNIHIACRKCEGVHDKSNI